MTIELLDRVQTMRLRAFAAPQAGLIASWVRSEQEARLLAPRVAPPITAQTIFAWAGPGMAQFVMVPDVDLQDRDPFESQPRVSQPPILGYGELNELDPARRSYWLGHLIIDPAHRGLGYGLQLTRLLMARAFERCGAHRVTLVVFPDNLTAVSCYKRAGFEPDGFENHRTADGSPIRLLRMAVDR